MRINPLMPVHACSCTHMPTNSCIPLFASTHVHLYIHIYAQAYMYIQTPLPHPHIFLHTHTYLRTPTMHVYWNTTAPPHTTAHLSTYMPACTPMYTAPGMPVQTYTYLCTCTTTCIHLHAYAHLHIYNCMHSHKPTHACPLPHMQHTHLYICLHIYACLYTQMSTHTHMHKNTLRHSSH